MRHTLRAVLLWILLLPTATFAQGFICAEGGGNANKGDWADEVFGWMVDKGGRGRVVILGTRELEQDDRPALFTRLGAQGVANLVLDREAADTQATYDTIAAARIVFIRGGAQDTYVRNWKGTRTQDAIIHVFKSGGVVAGTSAGCAVLGSVVYDALHGSLSAREALEDARHEHLSLTTGFLDLVPGVLFDTHFTERGRLARLPVMLAHCKVDLKLDSTLGIGVDPRTAVCIGPDGIAEIRGEGTATMLLLTPGSRTELPKGGPPTVTDTSYTQLCSGARYDLKQRAVVARPDGVKPIEPPAARRPVFPELVIDGSDAAAADAGTLRLPESPADAWLRGDLNTAAAAGRLGSFIIVPRAFTDRGAANAMYGAQRALAESPTRVSIAIWADEGTRAITSAPQTINATRVDHTGSPASPDRSVLVLDTRAISHGGVGVKTDHRPTLEGATLHLLAPGWSIDLQDGSARPPGRR